MEGPMNPKRVRMMKAASREIAAHLERAIDSYRLHLGAAEEKWGFALMIFNFNGAEFTWISNAQRADMLKALKEFIAKHESGEATMTSEEKN